LQNFSYISSVKILFESDCPELRKFRGKFERSTAFSVILLIVLVSW
jgi:hypothetical protein